MLAGLRILVADQHATLRSWMREQLSVIGATSISMASNASELIRIARTSDIDVIICDHHLDAKRDGHQLLEELRFQHILPLRSVFIIVTAERKYRYVVAAAEFAPDDYLIKPYTPRELSLRLERALRKKKALHHVFDALEACDHEAAIVACERAAKLSPRYILDTLRIKAESLVALGRVEEASALYETISRERAVPWARMGYAMMLQRQKQFAQAMDEATRLNEEYPEFITVYDLLAEMHEASGELSAAIEYLERASALTGSSNTERLRKIADLAETSGDRQKTTHTLQRIIERTRRTSMLKVDDYLALTRNLLEGDDPGEASRVVGEMKEEVRHLQSGELATEVASSMVARQRGDGGGKKSLRKALDLFEEDRQAVTERITLELVEEAVESGETARAVSIVADLTRSESLPGKLKARLAGWFSPKPTDDGEKAQSGSRSGEAAGTQLPDRIVDEMSEAIRVLDENWCEDHVAQAKRWLIDAFALMPRDKRVINAHIRYNTIAARNGGERHSPTARAGANA